MLKNGKTFEQALNKFNLGNNEVLKILGEIDVNFHIGNDKIQLRVTDCDHFLRGSDDKDYKESCCDYLNCVFSIRPGRWAYSKFISGF